MAFDRLLRFIDEDGVERYGNIETDKPVAELPGTSVQVVEGSLESGFKLLSTTSTVSKVEENNGLRELRLGWLI